MRWCTCTCSTSGGRTNRVLYKCPQTNDSHALSDDTHALFPPRPFPSSPLPPLQPLSVVSDEPETAFPLIPNGKHATVPQQPDYYCDAEIARLGRRLTRAAAIFYSNHHARPPPPLARKPEAAGFPFGEVHKAPTLLFLAGGGGREDRAVPCASRLTPPPPPSRAQLRSTCAPSCRAEMRPEAGYTGI